MVSITTEANSTIVQQHIPCPVCPSSDAYCTYADGHGYCYSCRYLYLPNKDYSLNEENTTYQYNSYRGISEETFRKYQALTKCSSDGKPISIGFKYGSATKVRTLDSKSFYWIGQHKPGLFGYDRFEAGAHRYVCITEGELDALSVWQATGVPSLSVQSAASAVSDCTAMRSYLNSYERIYLFFD